MFRCDACGNTKFFEYRHIGGHRLKLCLTCGLLLTQTSERERNKYIKEKYTKQYTCDYKIALPKLYKRYAQYLSLIERYKAGGKLLDVGCGTGYFLKYLKENNTAWRVVGVEPSALLRRVASKNASVKIKDGTLGSIPFADNYFDVITCFDVLEHSMDLTKNIRELRRVLKSNGLLIIQAPNYKSFMAYITRNQWDWWCIPDHVLHFSYHALKNFLKQNKFFLLDSYTYEDQIDYVLNIRGIFAKNDFTKIIFYLILPFFLVIERIGWLTNNGGLSVVVARK